MQLTIRDITKFEGFSCICPNEKEARISLKDKDSGLESICQELIKNKVKSTYVNSGAEGLIAYDCNNKTKLLDKHFPHFR